MKTNWCTGKRLRMADTVMPRDDRTRKRVTGGIFLISAKISAILVAGETGHDVNGTGPFPTRQEVHVMSHPSLLCVTRLTFVVAPGSWDVPFPSSMSTCHCKQKAI